MLGKHLKTLKEADPGKRFESYYLARTESSDTALLRVLLIISGLLLFPLGLIMLVTPGPGILMMLLGLALLARESLTLARGLDVSELWLRAKFEYLANLRSSKRK